MSDAPNDDKVKIFICRDHFDRLLNNNVCSTCPSNPHNEDVVKLLAQLHTDNEDQGEQNFRRLALSELKSLRSELTSHVKQMDVISGVINGNGKEGLKHRIAKMEIILENKDNNKQFLIMVLGLALSTLIGLGSLVIGLMN